MKLEHAITSIRSGRFRWSCPLDFNDPFDCRWDTTWIETTPQHRIKFAERLRRYISSEIDWSKLSPQRQHLWRQIRIPYFDITRTIQDRNAYLQQLLQESEFEERKSVELHEELHTYRMLCMSEDPSSLLMWSHYADNHAGVVLEIDTTAYSQEVSQSSLIKIRYVDQLPHVYDEQALLDLFFDGKGIRLQDAIGQTIIETKGIDWAYEKEWRLVVGINNITRDEHKFFKFSPNVFKSITLGCAGTAHDANMIKRLVSNHYPDAKVYKAYKTRGKFGLDRREI